MRFLGFALGGLFMTTVLACSGSTTQTPASENMGAGSGSNGSGTASVTSPAAAFIGTYQATWSSQATITSPAGVPPQAYSDTGVITVTAMDDSDILMSWQVGNNAPSGTISFAVNGSSATATGIGTGGTCWMGHLTNGNAQTSCALMATAQIDGDTLTQHQTGTATGTTSANVAYTATYEGVWTGTRIHGGATGAASPSSANASDFVGTWNGTASSTITCPSGSEPTTGASVESVTAGSGNGISTFGGYCRLNWTVGGSTATLDGSQPCPSVTTSNGGSWTPTFTSGTITVDGSSATISETGTGIHASASLPTGSETCTFVASGSYTKG